jgi:hypothetical protein
MDNYYHILIETPDSNLAQGMRQLNGMYQRFNKRHGRVGHVFQGRFKAILIDGGSYLLELCRYVVLNPVRAGIVRSPGRYEWSSYRATAGLVKPPFFLSVEWILSQFGAEWSRAEANYRKFVREGIGKPNPFDNVRGQILVGEDDFVSGLGLYLSGAKSIKELPRAHRFADRPKLEELFGDMRVLAKGIRNSKIKEAHLRYGYTLAEIGRHLELHYTTVSKIVNEDNS